MRAIHEIAPKPERRTGQTPLQAVGLERETARIRVLVADDHTLVRQGIASLIGYRIGMQVVGEASTGREALRLIEALKPDVVLMDIAMPEMNGLEATYEITRRFPGVRILVLSTPSYADQLVPILRAGASGYLLKDANSDELFRAIEAIHRGNNYFSPAVSAHLVQSLFLVQRNGTATTQQVLTTREREILDLLAEGLSNQEMAGRLYVSVKTVEAHKSHMIAKLGLKGALDLLRYAVRRQMVNLDA